MTDRIDLANLCVDCVVGVYPQERVALQPLRVDLTMWLDTERAARTGRLRHTVHYGVVAEQIRFLLTSCRFHMLETAADVLCRYLLAEPAPSERRASIERVALKLTKPEVLGGVAVPSLTIERGAEWVSMARERKPFGTVDVVAETRHLGVYRLNIAPGRRIPLHVHRVMNESEYVLTDGLYCQGEPAPAGTINRWPHGAAHYYENPTQREQSILCVDSPPFIEEDEVAAEGAPVWQAVDR